MDPRIASISRDTFEQLWLLGDLLGRTDEKASNYIYLDSLFDLGSPATLWVEGNHDVNTGIVLAHPLTPPKFSRHQINNLNIWRLNTNLFTWPDSEAPAEICATALAQCDSLQTWTTQVLKEKPAQLVVLHHQALLTSTQYTGRPLNKVWNYYNDRLNVRCDPPGTFTELLLPLFKQIQANGTQVTFVGGDIGQRIKTFDHVTTNGIRYLGTGINNSMDPRYPPRYVTSFAPDSILTFQYYPATEKLEHRFIPLGGESAAYQSIWDK